MSGSSNIHPMSLKVTAMHAVDEERLRAVLVEIGREAPSVDIIAHSDNAYTLSADRQSTLISICGLLRHEHGCPISVTPIRAVLLETIRKEAEAEGKYIRHIGVRRNYGHCRIRLKPSGLGGGYKFANEMHGGLVPKEYIKAIDQGIREALGGGTLAGFPMVDITVTLYDGSYHDVDSNDVAFKIAGFIAFKEAARKASPVLLEPVMEVKIHAARELDVVMRREVSGVRGRIERQRFVHDFTEIVAVIPLSELLLSSSGSIARYPMKFAGFEPVSDSGPSADSGIGMTANKPNYPPSSNRSGASQIEHKEE